MTTAALLVVQTFYVDPPMGTARQPHFEVHVAPAVAPQFPRRMAPRHLCFRCTVLVTRDPALYQEAIDGEGTGQRFIAHYHREASRQVLDRLEAAP